MDRICAWTGGHPYLTQRVARGVARKGGRLEDVERVVREQLLAPGAAEKDPLLGRRARVARRAFAAGAACDEAPAPARRRRQGLAARRRRRSGSGCGCRAPCASTRERKLRIRNRIVKELVAARWLKTKRSAWRCVAAAAAVLLVVLAAGGYWYTQTSTGRRHRDADERERGDRATAEEAYRRLRGLPGFAERADELWLEALGRQSRAATTLAAATAADTRLRELPGQDATADRTAQRFLVAPRARASARRAARRGDSARAACRGVAGCRAGGRVAYLAELAGDDYTTSRTFAAPRRPRRSIGTWCSREATLVSIDAERQVLRTPFGAAAGSGALGVGAAQAHGARASPRSTRELAVEGEGTAGEFELSLDRAARRCRRAASDVDCAERRRGRASTVAARRRRASRDVHVPSRARLAAGPARRRRRERRLALDDRRSRGRQHRRIRRLGPRLRRQVRQRRSGRAACNSGSRSVSRPSTCRPSADRAVAWPTRRAPSAPSRSGISRPGSSSTTSRCRRAPRQVALDATGTRVLAATERALMLWNSPTARSSRASRRKRSSCCRPCFPRTAATSRSPSESTARIRSIACCAAPTRRSSRASKVCPTPKGGSSVPDGRYVALQGPDTRRARARDAPRRRARATGAHARRRTTAALSRRHGVSSPSIGSAPSRHGRWRRPR